MKRSLVFVTLSLGVALLLGCSDNGNDDQEAEAESDYMANLVGASSNMPYGELDDPNNEDYDAVIEDGDGWLIQLNVDSNLNARILYSGRLYAEVYGEERTGELFAVYDRENEQMVVLTDYQYGRYESISYSMTFTNETDLDAVWMFDNGYGNVIDAELIYGYIYDHDADPAVAANWQPKQAEVKERGPVSQNR